MYDFLPVGSSSLDQASDFSVTERPALPCLQELYQVYTLLFLYLWAQEEPNGTQILAY